MRYKLYLIPSYLQGKFHYIGINMKITHNPLINLKYIPKLWSTLVYFVFIGFGMIFFLSRNIEELRFDIVLRLFPDYQNHISNFSISLLLVLIVGYIGGIQIKSIKGSYIVAALLIVANLVYELFLPFINTMDIIDAYYGIVGSLVPFLFLIPYQLFGIQENPNYIDSNKKENPVL